MKARSAVSIEATSPAACLRANGRAGTVRPESTRCAVSGSACHGFEQPRARRSVRDLVHVVEQQAHVERSFPPERREDFFRAGLVSVIGGEGAQDRRGQPRRVLVAGLHVTQASMPRGSRRFARTAQNLAAESMRRA
ncbi:hypothetical protein [Lentzea sp. E54]|uniref:hypothetical protein n=1 Tax=Lentzea xerophila TaxID=3435883 RepID=UPI003DA4F6DD